MVTRQLGLALHVIALALLQPYDQVLQTDDASCCCPMQRSVEVFESEKQTLESDNAALRKALHSLEVSQGCSWARTRSSLAALLVTAESSIMMTAQP